MVLLLPGLINLLTGSQNVSNHFLARVGGDILRTGRGLNRRYESRLSENRRDSAEYQVIRVTPIFDVGFGLFTYEKRRGRESNPRIAVLQTATLPLGYPARNFSRRKISGFQPQVSMRSRVPMECWSNVAEFSVGRWTLSVGRCEQK
jgi:hypothetical protein